MATTSTRGTTHSRGARKRAVGRTGQGAHRSPARTLNTTHAAATVTPATKTIRAANVRRDLFLPTLRLSDRTSVVQLAVTPHPRQPDSEDHQERDEQRADAAQHVVLRGESEQADVDAHLPGLGVTAAPAEVVHHRRGEGDEGAEGAEHREHVLSSDPRELQLLGRFRHDESSVTGSAGWLGWWYRGRRVARWVGPGSGVGSVGVVRGRRVAGSCWSGSGGGSSWWSGSGGGSVVVSSCVVVMSSSCCCWYSSDSAGRTTVVLRVP